MTTHNVMLNLCYAVPVRLLSSYLLLMSIFLLLPDAGRLANLLLLHRAIEPAEVRPLFQHRWLNRGQRQARCRASFSARMIQVCLSAQGTTGSVGMQP